MIIVGAGLAGLLAGCHFQNAAIIEAGPKRQSHKALLRFRSSSVGDSVGVEFKSVKVYKGIYVDGKFESPNIKLANQYSKKVIGSTTNRSIWDINTVERYIAPEDFIDILIDKCRNRISWNEPLNRNLLLSQRISNSSPIISTMPLPILIGMLKEFDEFTNYKFPEFKYSDINVVRWRINNCDVNQTIYFPDPDLALYRASITGSLLIAEFKGKMPIDNDKGLICEAFGICGENLEKIEYGSQQFGKILEIDDNWRKAFIHRLTNDYSIFSLGRFGTWRNILLDDVIHDISVLKRLIGASKYDIRMNSI